MPPGAKKTISPEEAIAAKKEQLEALQQQCYAVEKMLGISTSQMRRVEAEHDDILRQIAQNANKLADLEKSLDENVNFMRNLSNNSAEQLRQRYETIQRSVNEAEKENEMLRQKIKDTEERKEEELRQCNEEVAAQQHVIDQKALLFGIQLKERLRKN